MDAVRLRPAGLTANRQEETLEILWADGHLSVFPLAGLRNVFYHELMMGTVAIHVGTKVGA